MPHWSTARRTGQAARQRALSDRAAHEASEPRTIKRSECYWCGGQDGLRWQVFDVDGISTRAMVCRECRQEQAA
jgi:hypothetical protein